MHRTPSAGRSIATSAVLALAVAAGARGATQETSGPSLDLDAREGALRNQCFVPVDGAATARFAEGDAAWRANAIADALDAWRAAVAESPTGAFVPWIADLDADAGDADQARAFDGVEEALLARLALDAAVVEAWRARFEDVAAAELRAAGGSPSALAALERRLPATDGALRAALALGDAAFERGDALAARTWYGRAERHASLAERDAATAAIAARGVALTALAPPFPIIPPTTALGAAREVRLTDDAGPPPLFPGQPLGAGMRAGAVALGPARVAVQTATRVHVVDLAAAVVVETIEPAKLIASVLGIPPRAYPAEAPPGWALAPVAADGRILVVAGRASVGRGRGNALVAIEPGTWSSNGSPVGAPAAAAEPALARAAWAAMDDRWLDPDGAARRPALLSGLENVEFQPGPALAGGVALAQTRRGAGEIEAHLVAHDAATGEPRWRSLLGKGRELSQDSGRFVASEGRRGTATPLLVCDTAVFCGTQLGLGALVDAVDGRVRWCVKNRRRPAERRGWTGTRAAWSASDRLVVWAPADGDFLYWLPAGSLERGPSGPFSAAPAPIGAGTSLQAVAPGARTLLLARAGSRSTISAWSDTTGERREALHLLPGEPLREGLTVSGPRVLVASDRALYLFDLERDLLLLDRVTLAPPGAAPAGRWAGGGAVLAVGPRLVVVGHDHLTVFDRR